MDRAVNQGPWLQERVGGGVGAGWQFQRKGEGWVQTLKRRHTPRPQAGSKGFGAGGVGGRGTGPRDGANFATCAYKKKKNDIPCGVGGGTRAREGGSKGFGAGGVGGRGTGPRDGANFATCVVFFTNAYKKKKNYFF